MKNIFLTFLVLCSFNLYSQNTNITGVITYLFNNYQGDKADIGAKVYVIDSITYPNFDFESISKFKTGKMYIGLYNSYIDLSLKNDEIIKLCGNKKKNKEAKIEALKTKEKYQNKIHNQLVEMAKYDVDTKEKFDSLDHIVYNTYASIIDNEDVPKLTINTTGSYKIPVSAGTYYVFIKSKNRTGRGISEIMGQIYCKKTNIKDGQIKDISHNFKP